ncbi:MAG TPA: sugar phosphate isomerase/epimerase [Firmicutes bacterium]|jgi:sugar phosphate isomerase/epimerase|nr:sugar phosphate isomerase/epimerase [Bacillota bacterium]
MRRPVTIFTGQWTDIPFAEFAAKAAGWGYDGLELACWGDHFDINKACESPTYCDEHKAVLTNNNLQCWAISAHIIGQMVLDINDARSDAWVPAELQGKHEEKAAWAIEQMKKSAVAAKRFGVSVVNGFTGSSIWHLIYPFPPLGPDDVKAGFDLFAERWGPIFDVFQENGIKFALEVHPTEIAYDIYTARMALDAVGNHPAFGFNFDPSHLLWQFVDPVQFIREFPDRIFHVHVKDAITTLDGKAGILSSHLSFGDHRRGWDFRSPGRGGVNFEEIVRALNQIGYEGPLSVEWEDSGMDREHGAMEALEFVRDMDFPPSTISFEAGMREHAK